MARKSKIWYWKARKAWYTTINGKRHKLGEKKKLAEAKFHALMLESPQVESESLVALIDQFLDWTQKHRAPRTYDAYQQRLQSFVDTIPSDLLISSFKPHHVTKWIDGLDNNSTTKNGLIRALKRVFNWAIKEGYIEKNPISHYDMPEIKTREFCPSEEQYKELLTKIKDQRFTDLVTMAWETGARPQELINVQVRHVQGSAWVFPKHEAKGKRRKRVVYLNDFAAETTKRLIEGKDPNDYLFQNLRGGNWTAYSVNCRFLRLKEKLGVKFCLYSLRHAFCTRMLKSGLDSIAVSRLMGHSSTAMVDRIYNHIHEEDDYLLEALKKAS